MSLMFNLNKERGDVVEVFGRGECHIGDIYQGRNGAHYLWVRNLKYAFDPNELSLIANRIETLDEDWLYLINSRLDQAREYDGQYSRMDIIGQNGNDGLHYAFEAEAT